MSVLFNLASLILGLASWVLAGIAILKINTNSLSFLSLTCCALSLVFQILEINNRVNLGDFSAIMDTIGAVVLAASVMSGIAILLNLAALTRTIGKNK